MFNTLSGKRIALFGFAFKADTGDTRESPAITVCRQLLEERARIRIHDPKALDNARMDLQDAAGDITYCEDPYEAAEGAHALVIMTDWKCFRELDYQRIFERMEKPAFLFDGRNLLDPDVLFRIGFHVYPIGQKPLTHF